MRRALKLDTPVLVNELQIDEANLEGELLQQPLKMAKISELTIAAYQRMSLKELELKEKEAELAKQFREINRDNKVTESMVKEFLQTHEELRRLRRELIDAEIEYKLYDSMRYAFVQRAAMLELLIKLRS